MRLSLVFLLLLCAVPCAAQEAATSAPAQPERSEESAASAPEGEELAAPAAPATPVAPAAAPAENVAPVASAPPPAALQLRPRRTPAMDEAERAELAAVDARLREIRLEMPRLGGPIAMLAAGGVGAFLSAYLAMIQALVTMDVEYDDYGGEESSRTASERAVLRGLGVGTLVGLVCVVGGGVWLKRNLRERRAYKPELDALKLRRRQLLEEVHYGFNGSGLTLTATF